MDNVINIDDYRPHSNARMKCDCGKEWIATYPSQCTELECPECSKMVKIDE